MGEAPIAVLGLAPDDDPETIHTIIDLDSASNSDESGDTEHTSENKRARCELPSGYQSTTTDYALCLNMADISKETFIDIPMEIAYYLALGEHKNMKSCVSKLAEDLSLQPPNNTKSMEFTLP